METQKMIYLILISIGVLVNCSSQFILKTSVHPGNLPIESKDLFVPPLTSLAEVLEEGLKSNFEEVTVEVVDCPDLTRKPFTLASKGLGGNPRIIELGGTPNLLPVPNKDKVYDLKNIADLVGSASDSTFILGAGAGPFPYVGGNSEGIYNLEISNGSINQQSRIVKQDKNDDGIEEVKLPNTETRLAFLANLLITEGKPGPVIKIHVKKRIGDDNFSTSIRKILVNKYQNENIGIGGVFLVKEGKANQHVMGDFLDTPIDTDEKFNKWLRFKNMSAPLIALGTLVNGDMDLNLTADHFHSFSHHGEAGHYHYDTTPETVEYLGYFNVGEKIYRIDRPT